MLIPVSIIVPVYNDRFFLEYLLPCLSQVAEVVVVDGGKKGCSTDGTRGLSYRHKNVVYTRGCSEGFFITDDGRWDRKLQIETGLNAATQDIIMTFSVDRIPVPVNRFERLVSSWNGEPSVWYARSVDFWMDTKHVRPYREAYNSFSNPVFAFAPSQKVQVNTKGDLYVDGDFGRVVLEGLTFYHFGWIRPFGQQVRRHLDHIYEGFLGDVSDRLVAAGHRACETWAIQHSLGYRAEDGVGYLVDFPDELEELSGMNYMSGFDKYRVEYEEFYEVGFFEGILNTCPSDLIVHAVGGAK